MAIQEILFLQSASTIRRNCSEVATASRASVADDGHIVEGIVALAAHSVKQEERRGWTSGQIFLRELDNCDVVTELSAWPLSVAEHESQRALNGQFRHRWQGSSERQQLASAHW